MIHITSEKWVIGGNCIKDKRTLANKQIPVMAGKTYYHGNLFWRLAMHRVLWERHGRVLILTKAR